MEEKEEEEEKEEKEEGKKEKENLLCHPSLDFIKTLQQLPIVLKIEQSSVRAGPCPLSSFSSSVLLHHSCHTGLLSVS